MENMTNMIVATNDFENKTFNNSHENISTVFAIPARKESLVTIEIAIQVLIFCIAITGNFTVIVVLIVRRKKLSRMHLLMLHLSAADLSVAFFNVLSQLIWDITYVFHGSNFICKTVKYLQVVVIYASSYVLVTTAIDRYIAICFPFLSNKLSSKIIAKLVTCAWGLALIFAIPQLIIFSRTERAPGVFDCWAKFDPSWTLELYITWNTVSVFLLPVVILVYCYGNICYVVWRRGKVGEQIPTVNHSTGSAIRVQYSANVSHPQANRKNKDQNNHGISRAKIKTVRLTLTVVCCYVTCWSPFYVAQMWAAFDTNAPFYGK